MVTNKIFQEKKTEKLLMATEDQTLGIKAYRATILNQQRSKKCRMCNKRNETIMHILSKYSKPAQTEHTKHNDKVAPMVHLELCSKYGFESDKHWYEHRMNGVIKTRIQRYYWDLDIRTDRVMEVIHPILCSSIRRIRKRSSLMWLYPRIFVLGTRRLKRYCNTKILH